MHELSVALDLIDAAASQAERLGATRVHALHVGIGVLSGISKDALLFSFELAAAGTVVEGARLEFEDEALVAWCTGCNEARPLASCLDRRCPVCQQPAPELLSGDGLVLKALEVETVAAAHR